MNYYALVSRSLIALLFVVAGIQKIMAFKQTSGFIATLVPASLAMIVTVLVIVIEIVVALAFAWGYRVCLMGWILAGFTVLATVLVHRDFSVGPNMIMSLKNLAIVGGLLLASAGCGCGTCPASKAKHGHHEG
jgi:putative oxidoreductase